MTRFVGLTVTFTLLVTLIGSAHAGGLTGVDTDDTAATQQTLVWGDLLCDGAVDIEDLIAELRDIAIIQVSGAQGECPSIGTSITVGEINVVWGDINCDGPSNGLDALLIVLAIAGLPQEPSVAGCPAVGDDFTISSS